MMILYSVFKWQNRVETSLFDDDDDDDCDLKLLIHWCLDHV